ncbi:hypothetical protein DER45DRAFT_646165 [Fusarium avenaceum]|nr:hypothetical protein DER45DRAFT_646165 [Fusarium avenaceum]
MPQRRTHLGPLTTEWEYPDSCTVPIVQCRTCKNGWQGQVCGDNVGDMQGVADNTECWPPATISPSTVGALNGWGYYSPAVDCPRGYEPACSATGTQTSDFEFQFSVSKDETVTGCCPSGYTCKMARGGAQTCAFTAYRGTLEVAVCVNRKITPYSLPIPAKVADKPGEKTVTIFKFTAYAPMFQLNRREEDSSLQMIRSTIVAATSRHGMLGPTAQSTSTSSDSTAQSTSISGSFVPPDSSGGGLSKGAQAGIGVGVSVIGLGIIGAAFYLWRRRRKATPAPELVTTESKPPTSVGGTQNSTPPQYRPVELDATHPAELDALNTRHEM